MRIAPLLLIALACGSPARHTTSRIDAAAAPTPATAAPAAKTDFDIRIIGGDVIDGTGHARVREDVGIKGDTIVALGDLSKATSKETIDAHGQVVTPGFIDLLGHSEGSVLIDPPGRHD